MIVGPLSFIRLMGPHLARIMGMNTLARILRVLLGGCVMLFADVLGRTVIFPFQVPAGLLAAVLGSPYLLRLLKSRLHCFRHVGFWHSRLRVSERG
ncbi:iron chelate uptake ABC transporter family permease subunit [Hansschlegelia plantiphila]|uniref:Iron ABC transporter permease n=1 Tax=Hansschlegelia plantiphila TaxID=374655 RepID=A0A9W6MXD8_9HYPH|nr:iron chelate uptake ABC transporter family permease subunit [Hansschlegelia plantiphila]GLK69792.1 hypothetical protein GCM10008179_34300 [Hansschlegelia plantiphila]